MNLKSAFGTTLRALRKQQNRTLGDVAASAWMSKGHLSDVERSAKQPSFEMLALLISSLNITEEEFLQEVISCIKED